ncbi:hypothetical protein LWI29_038009 [Acer saccharum]|uniref:Protein FAR1-RELATED SEQUENCE n=1 Tax=Acer saccharum TaxID=4024 RepID=A0AA39RMP5_ACESA|nr:hypothetical protein LWI29_038009 [Acer saccharum]
MAKALTIVWPETHHHLCIWHIYQNAAQNLSGVFERFREFAKDLSECIYEYEEEDEFLDAWEMMLEKYNLKSNEWLEKMFRLKKNWAMVYGRETFCADMMTTQRSESMNNVLKNYMSYKHDLVRFFHHFDRLIEDRRYEELTYDFKATQSSLKLSVNIEILKHASSIYTPAVFKMFQVELGKAYDCVLSICGDDGMLTKYKVTHHKRRFHHSVEFNSSTNTVIRSCKKFEFSGILCSHALKVLPSKNVLKIPTQYILKRWTKYAKHGEREVVSKSSLNEDAKASMAKRYRDLCRLQTQVATKAAMTEQTYEIAMNSLYKVIEDVEAHMRGMEVQDLDSSNNQGNTLPTSDGNVMDGKIKGVKTKGRPHGKSGRFKSALERATKKKKVVQKKSSLQV